MQNDSEHRSQKQNAPGMPYDMQCLDAKELKLVLGASKALKDVSLTAGP